MQYASPKAIWNVLFGVNRPSFEQTEGISMFQIIHLYTIQWYYHSF